MLFRSVVARVNKRISLLVSVAKNWEMMKIIRLIYNNYLENGKRQKNIECTYVCVCVLRYIECKQALNIVTAQYKAMLYIVVINPFGYLKS